MEQKRCIFFWHEYEKYGCFSNWYESPFMIDGFQFAHVEQYIMAQKAKLFHDTKNYTAILKAKTPKECKQLGRAVSPYDEDVWEKNRYEILKKGLTAKFTQNEELKNIFLSTGDAILAEASPFDAIFGIKLAAKDAATISPDKWPGRNLLGKALMEVRAELS